MMNTWPERFENDEALDDFLSRPSAQLIDMFRGLDGDVAVLGAGGKIGPSLTRMAARALREAGGRHRVFAVDVAPQPALAAEGIETFACDLLDPDALATLPPAPHVLYLVGRKFGSTGSEHLTWAVNVLAAHHAAQAYRGSRVVAFSTGCVYPVLPVGSGGATEHTRPDPVGEYAMSSLGRERVFDVAAERHGTRVLHFRLNYAVELRYGVLVDIARAVHAGEPVDLTTDCANVIWQGDVCDRALRSLALASTPARVLNVTGPETFSVRAVAETFGRLFDKPVRFAGTESGRGYLSDARESNACFGYPSVPLGTIIAWTAAWIARQGTTLGKPTHFETQNGVY